MGHCRTSEETIKEINRIRSYFEAHDQYWTQDDVIINGLKHTIKEFNIPEKGKNRTEQDVKIMINILKKKGIEYPSMVIGRND